MLGFVQNSLRGDGVGGGGGGEIRICQYKRGKNIGDAVMFL